MGSGVEVNHFEGSGVGLGLGDGADLDHPFHLLAHFSPGKGAAGDDFLVELGTFPGSGFFHGDFVLVVGWWWMGRMEKKGVFGKPGQFPRWRRKFCFTHASASAMGTLVFL
jgi:hypothetical protein